MRLYSNVGAIRGIPSRHCTRSIIVTAIAHGSHCDNDEGPQAQCKTAPTNQSPMEDDLDSVSQSHLCFAAFQVVNDGR